MSTRRQITTGKPRPVTNLAPPTSLTTADILDLPIIFADNDSNLIPQNIEEPMVSQRKSNSKYVVINKQTLVPTTQQNILKRPSSSIRQSGQKYARIIINQNQLQENEDKRHVLITNQKIKPENEIVTISPKKIDTCSSLEFVDLESELKTNTVPKPMHTTVVSAQSIKNKPDIKHFASRNVIRVPISGSSNRMETGSSDVYVLNRNVSKRKIKSPDYKRVNYRLDFEDDIDDPDIEK